MSKHRFKHEIINWKALKNIRRAKVSIIVGIVVPGEHFLPIEHASDPNKWFTRPGQNGDNELQI